MDDATVLAHLEAWVDRRRDRFVGPAISIGVTDRERTIGTLRLGDAAPGVPLRDDHRFLIASVSKSFTAALVLQEVDAGRLALDAPVATYLPWFTPPTTFAPMTVHHLLTHTAGISTGWDTTGDAIHELLLLRDQEVGAAPGEHHVYSNAGYKALGLILEAVTGRPWWELAIDRILEPLGMDATEPVLSAEVRPALAPGWVGAFDDRPWHPADGLVVPMWSESYTADGTICSTADDMCRYLRAYLDPGSVIPTSAVDAMTTPHIFDPEDGVDYGYGLWSRRDGETTFHGHSGSLPGYRSMILFDRASGYGGVVLTNGATSWDDRRELLAFAIRTAAASAEGRGLPELPDARALADLTDADAFLGVYVDDDDEIEISRGDGVLELRTDGRVATLTRMSGDTFVSRTPGWDRYALVFERDAGDVVGLVYGGRALERPRPSALDLPPPPMHDPRRRYVGRYRGYGIEPMHVEVLLRRGSLRLLLANWGEEYELVEIGDDRFRVGAEPWQPGRATFEAATGEGVTRLVLDGGSFYRVPDVPRRRGAGTR